MPGAAQVTNGGTSQITSYATFLGSLPVQVWDTPGLDEELDGHHLRHKIKDWLHLVSSSHCKKDLETERPYLMVPAIQVVWCMHVGEITDPVTWQQFRAIYEECCCQGVITIVLINQVPMGAGSDWEVPCEIQLHRLGLSVGPVLMSVRSHGGVSSPEHEDDVKALSHLIRQHHDASQNLPGGFTLKLDFGHPRGLCVPPSDPIKNSELFFRCGWVAIHPESMCNCIVRYSDLPSHLRLCHGIGGISHQRVTCRWEDCNQSMRRDSILRHVGSVHLQITWYTCTSCWRQFSHLDTLLAHIRRQHGI
ncbi:hypothetical protein HD554DRAFT_792453 [Boletus coccyginus]|nr:hypothetical protein HD554DRAFT_792453 [Boletus coccyginus]